MKLRIVILVFGLIIISMGDVYGADWKPYYFHEILSAYYDAQSITRPSKNIVRVWEKRNFTKKGVVDMMGRLGKEYKNLSHLINLQEINCIEKKARLLSGTWYDNKGGVIDSFSSPLEWDFIVPESMNEALYEEICK